jgi:hypothetical protein
MGAKRGVYRVFVGKSGGKRGNGRRKRGCEYNIKIDIQGVGFEGMDWIYLT